MKDSKIEEIITKRKDEAIKKMVPTKVRTIATYLGLPIIHQGDISYDEWEYRMNQMYEGDENVLQIGWLYNGLSIGKHIEITFFKENEDLTVLWKGVTVYHEQEGNIVAYVPSEWEMVLNTLYEQASKIETKIKKVDDLNFIKKQETAFAKMTDFLHKTWGIKI